MKAEEIRFIKGRLKFLNESGQEQDPAPFPSMVVLFRNSRVLKVNSGPGMKAMER